MPTAHKVVPGCTLNRRTFLQSTAMTGAAAIGATASSGTVAAENGIVDGLKEAIGGAATVGSLATDPFTLSIFVGAIAVGKLTGAINTDPSADRQILHQLVHNEISWMDSHFVNFGNYMTDSRPIASLEARHGMASAWEMGEGSSGGHDTSLQRIRQYFELPEFNHLHAGNKALLQLSYIAGSGADTDPVYDITGTAYIDGAEADNVQVRLTDTREVVELTLHDGTVLDGTAFDEIDHIDSSNNYELGEGEDVSEGAFYTPVFEFVDFDTDEVLDSMPVTQDVIDSWTESGHPLHGGGSVVFTGEDGTTEYETDLSLTVQNVGDASEDPSLGSQRAFDGNEWFRLVHEVRDLSDEVVSWYDQSFVEDIYAELDAENITPEQVRSPEGMARFLSGTDDPADSRFQVSWMQQFGFERPDMEIVRGMDVEWTGATDTMIDSDPDLDDRHPYPSEHVDNQPYTGILFGSDIPEGGLQPDDSVAVGVPLYAVDDDTDELCMIDATTGDDLRRDARATFNQVEVSSDGETIYGLSSGGIYSIDAATGQENWVFDDLSQYREMALSPNDDHLAVGDGDNEDLILLDTADGSVLWTKTNDSGSTTQSMAAVATDGETIVGHPTNGDQMLAFDTDGNELWTHTFGTDDRAHIARFAADGMLVVYGGVNDNVYGFDTETQTEEWEKTTFESEAEPYPSPDGSTVYVAYAYSGSYHVFSYDVETGTENFDESVSSRWFIGFGPDGRMFASTDSGLVAAEVDDSGIGTTESLSDSSFRPIVFPDYGPVDAMIPRALMFDEGDDDRDGEGQVDLWDGTLEVIDQWDAEGATVEHVDDQTIADIEALAATPDSIDTVIEEMDEFDSVDDIRFVRHVEAIVDHYNADATVGNEDGVDIRTQEPDYESQNYDTFDSSEFASEMESLEAKIDQLESEEDDGGLGLPSIPGFDSEDLGSAVLGVGIIGVVVLALVGIVTDLIPGLGN
ncbi:WD40 repeat domain-containing protein [Halomontanus rarus]|uniref:WD40 repeat domain-containing protein n=1 Tax=Halomontanus rarus TaxID=3034020 RepID=UPI0023E81A21|nr:PQQ-binding-like beta-propeller repeat protein [Halovivax sp. TS33]